MRAHNQHIIQKQTIEIEFENLDDSFGVQDRVAQVFYEKLQPRMEILLDEMFGNDQYFSIDKLEIDCGLLNVDNWEQEFTAQAMQKMKEGLVQVNSNTVKSEEIEEKTAAETFFFFLENGFLPWNKRINSISELEQLIKVDSKIIVRVKKMILQKANVAKRLANQFSVEFIAKLIIAFTDHRTQETEMLFAIHEKIKAFQSYSSGSDQLQKQWIDESLLTAFASDENKNRELLFFTFLLSKVDKHDEIRNEIREIITTLQILSDKKRQPFEDNILEPKKIKVRKKSFEKSVGSSQEGSQKHISESTKPADAIYIINAGLVLLHPFLPALFANLKLTEENDWIDEASKQKAVLSTEFLVTGKDKTEEFDLVLNKILCGYGIDEVVPTTLLPDEETKTECDVLLMEVIKHWDVLKNTSIAGLREGFLQRQGKLSRVDDGWLLQVEQKAIDVLLNHLPWGIGIIKLPWMNEMLVVEWT